MSRIHSQQAKTVTIGTMRLIVGSMTIVCREAAAGSQQ